VGFRDGNLGKVLRLGMKGPSSSCGAAIAAIEKVWKKKDPSSCSKERDVEGCGTDHQLEAIVEYLSLHSDLIERDGDKPSNKGHVTLSRLIAEKINDDLNAIIDKAKETKPMIIVGGTQINVEVERPPSEMKELNASFSHWKECDQCEVDDYFQVDHFRVVNPTQALVDLGLTDRDTFKRIILSNVV